MLLPKNRDHRLWSAALTLGLLAALTACSPADGSEQTQQSATPPKTGIFGGGQGKILFIDDGARRIQQFDLKSRTISTLATPASVSEELFGGISRASNGNIAVLSGETMGYGGTTTITIFDASGKQISQMPSGIASIYVEDAAIISPDGGSVAVVGEGKMDQLRGDDNRWFLRVRILSVPSGTAKTINVIASDGDLPAQKPSLAWTQEGTLLLLTVNAVYKIDAATGSVAKLHSLSPILTEPKAAFVNGNDIWFDQKRGNTYGGTIWSIDLANGAQKQRSKRRNGYGQTSPAISPDGQWLLLQQGDTYSHAEGSVDADLTIAAIPLTNAPTGAGRDNAYLLDKQGGKIETSLRMIWY